MAFRAAVAVANKFEKFVGGIRRRRFSEGRRGELAAVIIRAANENLRPRFRVCRRKIVPIRKRVDLFRRQLPEKSLGQIAKKRIAQTVNALEMFEEKDELLEMMSFQFSVHAVKRVRNCVRDLRRLQVALQVEDVIADTFYIAMLLFGDSPDKNVQLTNVVWEIRCDLFADKGARQVCNLQAALDRIVVGNRCVIHAALEQLAVQFFGI